MEWMENYRKDKSINHKLENPFADVLKDENICKVHISDYSQLSRVMGYAISKLRNPSTKLMLIQGQGKALGKVGTCVRILMTKHNNLHRCDALSFKIFEEIWMPRDPDSNLDGISVKLHIPALFVVLAKDDLPAALKSHPQRLQIKSATKDPSQSQQQNVKPASKSATKGPSQSRQQDVKPASGRRRSKKPHK